MKNMLFLITFVLFVACGPRVDPGLGAPRGLTATAQGPTEVYLSWTDTANGEIGIEVEREGDGAVFACVGTCAADSFAYLDGGLQPGVTYRYRARAVTPTGFSEYSTTVEVATETVTPPAVFTQRVLIEEATGTWCGYCPDGARVLDLVSDTHPGLVVGAALHGGDIMEPPGFDVVSAYLGEVTGYPTGAVSRRSSGGAVFLSRGSWESQAALVLAETATCGLTIDSVVDGTGVTVIVLYAFAVVPDDETRLTVCLTEDGITGYPQANYYDDDASSIFYQAGNPIQDYVHNHVVRLYLTSPEGDPVEGGTPAAGTTRAVTLAGTIDAAWDPAEMHVVALLHTDGGSAVDRPVLNVHSAPLDTVGGWD